MMLSCRVLLFVVLFAMSVYAKAADIATRDKFPLSATHCKDVYMYETQEFEMPADQVNFMQLYETDTPGIQSDGFPAFKQASSKDDPLNNLECDCESYSCACKKSCLCKIINGKPVPPAPSFLETASRTFFAADPAGDADADNMDVDPDEEMGIVPPSASGLFGCSCSFSSSDISIGKDSRLDCECKTAECSCQKKCSCKPKSGLKAGGILSGYRFKDDSTVHIPSSPSSIPESLLDSARINRDIPPPPRAVQYFERSDNQLSRMYSPDPWGSTDDPNHATRAVSPIPLSGQVSGVPANPQPEIPPFYQPPSTYSVTPSNEPQQQPSPPSAAATFPPATAPSTVQYPVSSTVTVPSNPSISMEPVEDLGLHFT